jgi:hypothetical protein
MDPQRNKEALIQNKEAEKSDTRVKQIFKKKDPDASNINAENNNVSMNPNIYPNMNMNPNANTNTSTNMVQTDYFVLDKKYIESLIPEGASEKKIEILPKDVTEWRWRFFKIGERKLVEMSYYDGTNRIYVDSSGNMINYDLDPLWDKYVVKTLYCYFKNS